MQVLLVNNRFKESTEQMAGEIAAKLRELQAEVYIDNGAADISSQIPDKLDLIIVLGGDGTILRASRQYALKQTPVLGVNMGTVGFLSHLEASELNHHLKALLKGEFTLDKRMILAVDIVENNKLIATVNCLNEVAVKSRSPHMISFDINIDEQSLHTFRGDGIIIATPTGSTAYNLSAGGPVLDPVLRAFIITPVAAHKLKTPSMVISGEKTITITPVNCSGALIGMDGQVAYNFEEHYRLIIKQANMTLNLINLKKQMFFHNVDNKLGR